jgi:hypothetical protein
VSIALRCTLDVKQDVCICKQCGIRQLHATKANRGDLHMSAIAHQVKI